LPCKIIKTIHVNEDSIKKARDYEKFANMILLDTATEKAGGSGIAHDWGISSRIVESTEIPVFLAGGLNPENVKEARETVKPYAVDVASGVEGADGGKDINKVKDFIRNAKGLEF
jgi:phosphoribosylanthranilate isomerase